MGHRYKKRTRMVIPPDGLLAGVVDTGGKDYRRAPGQDMTEWLTPCFFEFRSALKVEP